MRRCRVRGRSWLTRNWEQLETREYRKVWEHVETPEHLEWMS